MTALRAAAMLAALILSTPAHAQSQAGCPLEAQPPKKSGLGGLFAAARDAGLGQALVGGLAPSAEGQAAAALLSGDASGAVAAIPGARRDARTARLSGAVANMAAGAARSARSARTESCGSTAPAADDAPAANTDVWR